MKAGEGRAAGGEGIEMRSTDVGAEGAQVPEARVVEHDGDHVGGAGARLGLVREAGVDSAAVKPICWGSSMGPNLTAPPSQRCAQG